MNRLLPYSIVQLCALLAMTDTSAADERALLQIRARLATGNQPVRIVCFGDSITGINYRTGGRRAWPEMLSIALHRIYSDRDFQIINAGWSGDTTARALKRFDRDVISHHPDILIAMFGMNDLEQLSKDQFYENLTTIVRRARANRAQTILCTQNNIDDATAAKGRSNLKLVEYSAIIRKVALDEQVPVVDCNQAFEAIRIRDNRAWRMLFNDSIHPNMDGHKVIAEEVANEMSGQSVSLCNVPPPMPAIPRVLGKLSTGKAVTVLAMSPFDKLIAPVLQNHHPDAQVEVSSWPTASQSLADLLKTAKEVRVKTFDLIVVAVPLPDADQSEDQFRQHYLPLMKELLGTGIRTQDIIAFTPSLATADLNEKPFIHDSWIRQLIQSQDLPTLHRKPNDMTPVDELLTKWFNEQLAATMTRP